MLRVYIPLKIAGLQESKKIIKFADVNKIKSYE